MAINRTIGGVKAQYDKLLAFAVLMVLIASLLYLAVKVGMISGMQERFTAEIEGIVPAYPQADPVDDAPFRAAVEQDRNPLQIALDQWTNAVFVPETRVWCVDCRWPIPYAATTCPFCDAPQPLDPDVDPLYDGDMDGMHDMWEKEYGLNPYDRLDAQGDLDGDGYSNLAEFLAEPKTDPADPNSYPPPWAELRVEKITADPFKLRFKSKIKLPDGSIKFGINTRGDQRTYFAKLGEEVEGFLLVSYEEKFEIRDVPGWPEPRPVDVSVLTLGRGDKRIPLVKGEDVQYNEYVVHLHFTIDEETFEVRLGGTFELRGKAYELIEIDSRRESVVVRRMEDGKEKGIRRFPGEADPLAPETDPEAPSLLQGELLP